MTETYGEFRLPDRRPELNEDEMAWMVVLRSVFPGGVPSPKLRQVQALRRALMPQLPGEQEDGR